MKNPMVWFVYILENHRRNKSYVGKTNNPKRRLRQHNGEITGGARYTRGDRWRMKFLFSNMEEEGTALRLERNMKSNYHCKFMNELGKSETIRLAIRMQMQELGAGNTPADKRLRRGLLALQKVQLTKNSKRVTADMDIKIHPDPNLDLFAPPGK